jgi:hypothetical protein
VPDILRKCVVLIIKCQKMFEKNARNRLMHEYIAVVYPEIGCLERLPCSSGSSGGGRKYCRVAGMG